MIEKSTDKAIILANGKSPRKSVINFLKSKGFNKLICADGGANSAKKLGIIPDLIIGDLDSITNDTISLFKSKSKIIKIARQNDTDVEKCLKYCISKNIKNIALVGVTGDRLDHTFCNLGILLKYFEKLELFIIAENSMLNVYTGNTELKAVKNETISLYGFDKKTKIKSIGLKYSLNNISLPFGEKESTSNVAVLENIKLKIKGGKIFVIRDINTIMKHDLL